MKVVNRKITVVFLKAYSTTVFENRSKKSNFAKIAKWTPGWDFLGSDLVEIFRNKKYDKLCNKLKVNASYFVTRRGGSSSSSEENMWSKYA